MLQSLTLHKPRPVPVPAGFLATTDSVTLLRSQAGFPASNAREKLAEVMQVFAGLELPVFPNDRVRNYLGMLARAKNKVFFSRFEARDFYVEDEKWSGEYRSNNHARTFGHGTWYARWCDCSTYTRPIPSDILENAVKVRSALKAIGRKDYAIEVSEVVKSLTPKRDPDPFIRVVVGESDRYSFYASVPIVVVFGVWDEPEFEAWNA